MEYEDSLTARYANSKSLQKSLRKVHAAPISTLSMNRPNYRQVLECGGKRSATPLLGWRQIIANGTRTFRATPGVSKRCHGHRRSGRYRALTSAFRFMAPMRDAGIVE